MTFGLILITLIVIIIFTTIAALFARYKKCPSDKILVVYGKVASGRLGRVVLSPDDICNEVLSLKNFVGDDLEVMGFVVVQRDPNGAILGQELL